MQRALALENQLNIKANTRDIMAIASLASVEFSPKVQMAVLNMAVVFKVISE